MKKKTRIWLIVIAVLVVAGVLLAVFNRPKEITVFNQETCTEGTIEDNGTGTVTLTGVEFDMDWGVSKDVLNISVNHVYMSGYEYTFDGDFDIETLNSSEMELDGEWAAKYEGSTESRIRAEYDLEKK